MIKTLEKSGRTEEDAIQAALKELGLERDDVSVEILERAKSGFFGIGATQAVVRITYECQDAPEVRKEEVHPAPKAEAAPVSAKKPAEPVKKAEPEAAKAVTEAAPTAEAQAVASDENPKYAAIRSFLSGLLDKMDIEAEIEISERPNGGIDVNLSGNGMGAIIGRRGETLDAIQHLTNYVINRGGEKRAHINIDAESYRAKREDALTHLAEKMAEKAIKYKRSMSLEPMNSYERHVIHTALQNYEGVTTASTGEEPNRRVVVSYVKPEGEEEPSAKKPKFREWA